MLCLTEFFNRLVSRLTHWTHIGSESNAEDVEEEAAEREGERASESEEIQSEVEVTGTESESNGFGNVAVRFAVVVQYMQAIDIAAANRWHLRHFGNNATHSRFVQVSDVTWELIHAVIFRYYAHTNAFIYSNWFAYNLFPLYVFVSCAANTHVRFDFGLDWMMCVCVCGACVYTALA